MDLPMLDDPMSEIKVNDSNADSETPIKKESEFAENEILSLLNDKPAAKYEEDTDALTTLASAALQRNEESMNTEVIEEKKAEVTPWCDVGIVRGVSFVVKNYYPTSFTNEHEFINIDNLPEYSNCIPVDLEPGTAYKFRIAPINSCGRGEWSEVSAFKTCLPGYPGAPSSIKISKSPDGAHLSWEPPPSNSGRILEYSVCLAVRSAVAPGGSGEPKGLVSSSQTQLAFVRVYCGAQNQATVTTSSLNAAHIDMTNKPAIIFRIAAKNNKGYGPATQVRWLQESANAKAHSTNPKREYTAGNLQMTKKYKPTNF